MLRTLILRIVISVGLCLSLAPRPWPLAPDVAWATVPLLINYQGRLTDAESKPISGS